MLEVLLFILIGIILGVLVGVLPGLHPNTIAAIIIISDFNLENSVLLFSCLIVSNIFEFLSACYLGAPEEGESLAKMPLQKLLLDKRALVGMKIVAFTSVLTFSLFLIFGIFLITVIELIYNIVRSFAWILLFGISVHLIIKDKSIKTALFFFLLSGILGVFTFNLELKDPFLPMLTGLFGISSLIDFKNKENIFPVQMKQVVVESSFFQLIKASFIGIIGSIIMAIIPSMSPSQVGLISEEFNTGKKSDELKIASMTSINISDNILGLLALIAISKGRSGVVEKIGELINLSTSNYYLLLFTGFFSCVAGACLLIFISKKLSDKIEIFNNKWVKLIVIFFVTIMCFAFDSFISVLILGAATIIGYYCNKTGIRKSQLLGCLVVPTIIFYISIL